ncbi:MAG: BPL-N domain-containing protein [Candidatus Latescibacteria bacterium]|nr:BPL-N domain-containing protein [Candidatus Latescibacterota bacterium]
MTKALTVVLSLALGATTQARAGDWAEAFESRHSDPHANLYQRSKGSPGWSYAYPARAYLSMYRATKDTKWLDCMVVRIDNLLDEMRDVPDWTDEHWEGFKDGFRGWGSTGYTEQYDEFLVHDGHVCVPIARFVKTVYTSPALHKKYKAKADLYLRTLQEQIIAKWHANWDANRGTAPHLRKWGGWRHLPCNQYLGFGTLLLVLHEIAQLPQYLPASPDFREFYLLEATEMARYFKNSLRLLGKEDAYLWDYIEDGRPEDTGHANLVIEFALRAYHLGIVFEESDMKRFANTFVDILWNKDEAQPEFRSHLDLEYGSPVGKYHLLRWLWLYEFDPRIGRLIDRHYRNHPDKARFNEMLANLACWEAGVLEDDHPGGKNERGKTGTRTIRAAYIVYTPEGEGGVLSKPCVSDYLSAVEGTEIVSTGMTFWDVKSELTRDRYDVFYFPGGGKSRILAKALGKEGQDRIREFVRSGGGYLGICSGAYAAVCGPKTYNIKCKALS